MKKVSYVVLFLGAICFASSTIAEEMWELKVTNHAYLMDGYEKLFLGQKHAGAVDHRSFLAPMKADGSGFDWTQEFGYHNYYRAWYFDGDVGIGTENPQTRLQVRGPFTPAYMQLAIRNDGSDDRAGISFWNASHQRIGHFYLGYGDFIVSNEQAGNFRFFAGGSERLRIQPNGAVGIGTESPGYKLDVAGTVRADEIIVSTEGADFVFGEEYRLKPLSEVEAHINSRRHLPDIPSAESMRTEGVGVSELQTKLLQKVEELTLYIIEQEKRMRSQQEEIRRQGELIESLLER